MACETLLWRLALNLAKIVLCFPKFSTWSILSMQLALRNIKYNWLLSDKYLSTFTDINGRALYQNGLHLKCGVLYLTKCSLTTSLTTRPIRRHKWLHALRLIVTRMQLHRWLRHRRLHNNVYPAVTPQSTENTDRTILTLFTIAKKWLHRLVAIVRSKKLWATKLGKKICC